MKDKIEEYDHFKYPHIKNSERAYVFDNIYRKVLLVTKQIKLDGSQGAVFAQDGEPIFASRNVVLIDRDYAAFKQTLSADDQIQKYKNYFEQYPNRMLIGEWMRKEKKFYIFDEAELVTDPERGVLDQRRINFTERHKILKDEFDFSIIEPEIVLQYDTPTDVTVDEMKEILRSNSDFDTGQKFDLEGYVFKIYMLDDGQVEQIDILKILNQDYKREAECKPNVDKKPPSTFVFPEAIETFLSENPNLFEKVKGKVNSETITKKNRTQFVEAIILEYREHEVDVRNSLTDEEKEQTKNLTDRELNVSIQRLITQYCKDTGQ